MIGEFKPSFIVLSVLVLVLLYGVIWRNSGRGFEAGTVWRFFDNVSMTSDVINVVVVVCGSRLEESVAMIKSLLMFSQDDNVYFHIFADEENKDKFDTVFMQFPTYIISKFKYQTHDISLPEEHSPQKWNNSFKPCCTQRIFLPDLLSDVDRLIYVDTDVRFLVPVQEVWALFDQFNSVQIAGLVWHNENNRVATYQQKGLKFPFYKPYGLNSGLILMDLPRMRAANWSEKMTEYFGKYKDNLLYGDQDLFNIFFYYEPEILYKVDCKYNFRVCYCMHRHDVSCLTAMEEGVSVIHGTRSTFRANSPPEFTGFKLIGRFFDEYDFDQPFDVQLAKVLTKLANLTEESEKCQHHMDAIMKRLVDKAKNMSG